MGGGGAPNGAAVIATADGGGRWTPQVIPPTVGSLSGIACSDALHCTAVGQASQVSASQAVIITTVDGGAQWTQVPAPARVLDLTAVSCLADGWCMAVGSTAAGTVALVSTTSGAAWTQVGALPDSHVGSHLRLVHGQPACWVTGQTAVPSAVWSEHWP